MKNQRDIKNWQVEQGCVTEVAQHLRKSIELKVGEKTQSRTANIVGVLMKPLEGSKNIPIS